MSFKLWHVKAIPEKMERRRHRGGLTICRWAGASGGLERTSWGATSWRRHGLLFGRTACSDTRWAYCLLLFRYSCCSRCNSSADTSITFLKHAHAPCLPSLRKCSRHYYTRIESWVAQSNLPISSSIILFTVLLKLTNLANQVTSEITKIFVICHESKLLNIYPHKCF